MSCFQSGDKWVQPVLVKGSQGQCHMYRNLDDMPQAFTKYMLSTGEHVPSWNHTWTNEIISNTNQQLYQATS